VRVPNLGYGCLEWMDRLNRSFRTARDETAMKVSRGRIVWIFVKKEFAVPGRGTLSFGLGVLLFSALPIRGFGSEQGPAEGEEVPADLSKIYFALQGIRREKWRFSSPRRK